MNPVKLLRPIETLLGLLVSLLTAIILVVATVLSIRSASSYLKMKSM